MTNDRRVKIAVLGAGRWGIHLIRNFHHHPLSQVQAVVDPHRERLQYVQERILNPVTLATDWQSLRQNDIDAVVVATPASTHYPLIKDALIRGYHVLAEKPLTLDPQECVELTRLAAHKQRQLMVDHTYLFNPAVQRGQEVISRGTLGKLRYGYASRTHLGPVRQDVDALWDLAIHDLAIFNTWLGQRPHKVQANGRIWLQPPQTGKGLADLVWVTLFYPDGFEAHIHLCWLNPDKQRRLTIVGSQGCLIFDELATTPLTLKRGRFQAELTPTGIADEVVEVEAAEPLKRVCDRFLSNILDKPVPLSDGWTGAYLVHILQCLTQSLQQGQAITVPPLVEQQFEPG
ncbi:MAG: Gfo/Idh/MocA family protein [Cyanophyceae cyanobacterium]